MLNHFGPFLGKETVAEYPVCVPRTEASCLYRLDRGDYLYTIAPQTYILLSLGTNNKIAVLSPPFVFE